MKNPGTSPVATNERSVRAPRASLKRLLTGVLLGIATVLAIFATPASPAAAAAASSGSETVSGVILASGVSGTRTVVSSVIVAKGVFNGVGRIVEVPNLPTDAPNVSRVDLVYAVGTMHLVATGVGFTSSRDPRSCVFEFALQQNAEVRGGTGLFAAASGTFTQTVNGLGLGARNPDGSCSDTQPAAHEVDRVSGSGTLTF